MSDWRLVIADLLVLCGATALTVAVIGLIRIPNAYAKLHAASKALVLGDLVVLSAAIAASNLDVVARAGLVGLFLLVTAPVGAHALAHLEHETGAGDDDTS